MKLAVIGSRTFDNWDLLDTELQVYPDIEEIVSGGAIGADTMAVRWAKEHDIPVKIFHADWRRYGLAAGFNRNSLIVAYCSSLVAFWDGYSKGTQDSLEKARRLGKPTKIVLY